jgi:hypothetical protein
VRDADSALRDGGTLRIPASALYGPGFEAGLAPRLHSLVTKEQKMLWTLCLILLVLWILGIATSYTAGGLIHLLLVIALVVMVVRLFQGRRVV